MKNVRIPVLLLLITSVLLNIFTLNKLGRIQQDLANVNYSVNNMQGTIDRIPSSITSSFNQLRNETRWITPVDFETISQSKDTAIIKASWQVKDFKKNSNVFFNYNFEDKNHTIEAIHEGNGRFHATIEVQSKMEPIWRNTVTVDISKNAEREVVEEKKEEAPKEIKEDSPFQFFISVESDETIKTSDKGIYAFNDLQARLFGILESKVNIEYNHNDESEHVDLFLMQNFAYENTNEIKGGHVKVYKGKNLVTTIPLEPIDKIHENIPRYHASVSYKNDVRFFDQLVMEVTFKDGTTFSKEIYNE